MINIQLPIKLDYKEFIHKYYLLGEMKTTYKLTFNDGLFFVGGTSNLSSRIFNHGTMFDVNENALSLSLKQKRMFQAINDSETICFEIIGSYHDRKKFISNYLGLPKCLNMRKVGL